MRVRVAEHTCKLSFFFHMYILFVKIFSTNTKKIVILSQIQ